MPTSASRRALLGLLAFLLAAVFTACQAVDGAPVDEGRWMGKTVHTRVGMRVEPARHVAGWHMYSTNHLGLPRYIPPGSKYTVRDFEWNTANLVAEDGTLLQLEFVPRHHPDLTFDAWLDRQLSGEPVQLPSGLSSQERDAIAEGRYEVGMSRGAFLLAMGYPPTSLTPSPKDPYLTYQVRRFNRDVFTFDRDNKLSGIKH